MVQHKAHVQWRAKNAMPMEFAVHPIIINITKLQTFYFIAQLVTLLNPLIFNSFWCLISSECKVDGAAGDGTKKGTCTDAGHMCKADGICGAYQ